MCMYDPEVYERILHNQESTPLFKYFSTVNFSILHVIGLYNRML